MQDIDIKKATLVDTIKANMESHRETYKTAVEEFKRQQTVLLEELLEKARLGKPFDRMALSRMQIPEDHTDDYKLALEMLAHDEREVITLQQHEYRQYMRDEWEWRGRWAANTASYAMAAASPS